MITLSFSSGLKWVENNIVWGIPLIILILLVGIVLTIKLKFLQLKHLGKSLKCIVKNDDVGSGEVSSFGALCVSMAATLGTGKILDDFSCIIRYGNKLRGRILINKIS